MKKILIALTLLGICHLGANAQSKYAQNYKVCRTTKGHYYTCGKEHGSASAKTEYIDMAWQEPAPQPVTTGQVAPVSTQIIAPCNNMDNASSINMNNANSYEGYYTKHHITVSYDDMRNPYEGLPSRQNDGPQKNDYRNLNYNQTSIDLPASDGSK